jgi:hypothetical protein
MGTGTKIWLALEAPRRGSRPRPERREGQRVDLFFQMPKSVA